MRILVTGGSGYLGTHVRRFFEADDLSRRSGRNILVDEDAALAADYDVVIHLAAYLDKRPENAELCFQTNSHGAANVIKHLKPNSVFIYASTKDVYGANANSYDQVPEACPTTYVGQSALEWSKFIGERYVEFYARRQNVRACIFRMSTIYARNSDDNEPGFVSNYVESVKRGWPIKLPAHGQPIRDILHVDDFSRACKAFIDSAQVYGLYNLGGGTQNAIRLRDLVSKIGNVIELEPTVIEDDQMPHPVPMHYVSDLKRIRDHLDWQPQIGIEEGILNLV